MNKIKSITQTFLTLTLGLWAVGCTPLHISRTIGFPGLPPLGDVKKITVVEKMEDVSKPYQVVGKVTVYRSGTQIMKGASIRRITNQAATMGADGVIGLHRNWGGCLYSGLAVKWLAPGESPKPVTVPFTIAIMPIGNDALTHGDRTKLTADLQKNLMYAFETKGYYLMPDLVTGSAGGIEKAKLLDNDALEALGGKDVHLLAEVGFAGQSEYNAGIISGSFMVIHGKLLDKQTRKIVYEGTGKGSGGGLFNPTGGFIAALVDPNAKRAEAVMKGVMSAFRDLTDQSAA